MPARKKQSGKGIPQDILQFVKDHKIISSGLGLIPNPYAQAGAAVARQLGLGKKRKAPKRRQVGAGIFGDLGSGIGSVFGGIGSGLGSVAHGLFGSGMKKGKRAVHHRAIKV